MFIPFSFLFIFSYLKKVGLWSDSSFQYYPTTFVRQTPMLTYGICMDITLSSLSSPYIRLYVTFIIIFFFLIDTGAIFSCTSTFFFLYVSTLQFRFFYHEIFLIISEFMKIILSFHFSFIIEIHSSFFFCSVSLEQSLYLSTFNFMHFFCLVHYNLNH